MAEQFYEANTAMFFGDMWRCMLTIHDIFGAGGDKKKTPSDPGRLFMYSDFQISILYT